MYTHFFSTPVNNVYTKIYVIRSFIFDVLIHRYKCIIN